MTILFYPEFGPTTGTGHVMRCFALAEYCAKRGDTIIFLLSSSSTFFQGLLDSIGAETTFVDITYTAQSATNCINFATEHRCDWIFLDGYGLTEEFWIEIRNFDGLIGCFDDFGGTYSADLLVNQNSFAQPDLYRLMSDKRLLLGTQYVAIRQELSDLNGYRRKFKTPAQHILINLGGCDPFNVTLKIISGLIHSKFEDTEFVIIAGSENPRIEELSVSCSNLKQEVTLIQSTGDMAGYLKWADVAIGAGGTSVWERCLAGLPALTLKIAENQRRMVDDLSNRNCLTDLGWDHEFDSKECMTLLNELMNDSRQRKMLSDTSRKLVDGAGCSRIYNEMCELMS